MVCKMKNITAVIIVCSLCFSSGSSDEISKVSEEEKTARYWNRDAQMNLYESLRMLKNENVAKNVIIFLGDGMGMTTVTSMRIYKGQKKNKSGESELLSFDKFPYVSLSKTYAVDRQLSDSANTATAYLCGVKNNYGTIGVDGRVEYQNCDSQVDPSTHVSSILQWAQEKGKWTGFVTSTRVTHASPSGLYAHTADRDWEATTPDPEKCMDIAQQLVTQDPGRNIRVIMGGGRKNFIPSDKFDVDNNPGVRNDSRNLLSEWEDDKKARDAAYRLVYDAQELREIQPEQIDYLMGLFHSDHLPYVTERPDLNKEYPTLPEMTEKAIKILRKNPDGFFLMVEGGKIDIAHHMNWAKKALEEGVEFDQAIERAVDLTSEEDTLIVVTADHSHTFTVGGNYPMRGTNIIGLGGVSDVDNKTFTTLGYHNGPGYKNNSRDRNLTQEEAVETEFRQDALLPMEYETHGSEDVVVYARGPMAHLFHGVHEQSYIPHAMAYASCVGSNQEHCNSAWSTLSPNGAVISTMKFVVIALMAYFANNILL